MSIKIDVPVKPPKPSPYKHAWVKVAENDFHFVVEGCITQRIWYDAAEDLWFMSCSAKGKTYKGTRATLEEAAKASDRLTYKNFPHIWTVTDARAIIDSWKGVLKFNET